MTTRARRTRTSTARSTGAPSVGRRRSSERLTGHTWRSPSGDRERQRDPGPILGPDVVVATPPIDRVLGDRLELQVGLEQGRDDLAERPRPGELPALIGVIDGQPIDVLGRPALRGLRAAEVVVVG